MSHQQLKNKKPIPISKKHSTVKAATLPKHDAFSLEKYPWIYVILMFLVVSIIYFPIAFQKQFPPASDTIQWQGAAHRLIEYNKTQKDVAMWQPNMFSGMPGYLISFPYKFPFWENITKVVDYVMNWRIFLLFLGGLGVFLLLRLLGMDGFTSFFGAIAFIFSCHWTGLLDIGHNTKFRAIMWIPWVIWGMMYLKNKPGILGFGMTASFLTIQLRENHPQISYYMYLLIGMYWIYELIQTFGNKEWKKFILFSVLLIVTFAVMGLAVMNPMLSTWEYGHYTIRGGDTGLDKAYAQGWSFHPLEILTFIIPDFYGGINRTYWGWMDFTQIYNYCGILILALSFFAFCGNKRKLAWFLWISSILFLIMSFGKFGGALSDLLLKYLPYFNKFRVPSMLLTILQFNITILAALGLSAIITKAGENDRKFQKKVQTWLIIVAVIFLLFLVLGKGFFKSLPFTNTNELAQLKQNNAMEQLPQIKEMRLNVLYKSGVLSFLFLTLGFGLIYLYLRKSIVKTMFLILILVLAFIDLWIYTGQNLKNVEPASFNQDYFAKRDYDEFLLNDTDNYRIYPLNVGMSGKWAYYHQTIQGYHGAKLKRYQEVLENCLDAQLRQQRINWNLLNMLNVKYVLFSDTLRFFNMIPEFSSVDDEIVIHRNLTSLSRAWFVDTLKVMTKPKDIWNEINSDTFNPARQAIVEEKINGVEIPEIRNVKMNQFDLHKVAFETETDKQAFLTVSEVYYPAGWKAYIDGKETKIYPVNYILRGIIVPAGKHTVEMRFVPSIYKLSVRLSLIGILVSVLALIIGLFLWFISRKDSTKNT